MDFLIVSKISSGNKDLPTFLEVEALFFSKPCQDQLFTTFLTKSFPQCQFNIEPFMLVEFFKIKDFNFIKVELRFIKIDTF